MADLRAEAVLRGVSIARVVLERLGPPLRAAPETPVAAASDHDDAAEQTNLRDELDHCGSSGLRRLARA